MVPLGPTTDARDPRATASVPDVSSSNQAIASPSHISHAQRSLMVRTSLASDEQLDLSLIMQQQRQQQLYILVFIYINRDAPTKSCPMFPIPRGLYI